MVKDSNCQDLTCLFGLGEASIVKAPTGGDGAHSARLGAREHITHDWPIGHGCQDSESSARDSWQHSFMSLICNYELE